MKIEYEGTPFVGWQFQKNGQSIQEVLQKAIYNFSREKVVITGAGRTDSGVHALAQIAHFDLKKKINEKRILPAINQNIGNKPVTVLKINKVNKKFHARYTAKKRTYLYLIINRQSPLALQRNKAWHIRKKLDVKAMKKGAKILLITKNRDKITLQFTSRSFLQQQVRSMVGCLKYLGEDKWNLKDFKNAFYSKNRLRCAAPAPACGLYLKNISY